MSHTSYTCTKSDFVASVAPQRSTALKSRTLEVPPYPHRSSDWLIRGANVVEARPM
jgi:hypothetical protein